MKALIEENTTRQYVLLMWMSKEHKMSYNNVWRIQHPTNLHYFFLYFTK